MNILVWVQQIALAAVFAAHGWLFLSPPPDIAVQMNESLPRWFSLFLGVAEVLAAIGLTLPSVTRIMPKLTVAAGLGVSIVLVSATIWHLMRSEWSSAGITAILLLVALFVTHQRWRVRPIAQRA